MWMMSGCGDVGECEDVSSRKSEAGGESAQGAGGAAEAMRDVDAGAHERGGQPDAGADATLEPLCTHVAALIVDTADVKQRADTDLTDAPPPSSGRSASGRERLASTRWPRSTTMLWPTNPR